MDVDAEHRPLVRREQNTARIFSAPLGGTQCSFPAFSFYLRIETEGDDHGTRNPALAARRADTGDHSVVAVLRPLTPAAGAANPGSAAGGAFFPQVNMIEIDRRQALFR